MNIIFKPRRSGKTTELIKESHQKWMYILVANTVQARAVSDRARELGLDIPYPITVHELEKSKDLHGIKRGILVDEAQHVLEVLLKNRIETMTITNMNKLKGR